MWVRGPRRSSSPLVQRSRLSSAASYSPTAARRTTTRSTVASLGRSSTGCGPTTGGFRQLGQALTDHAAGRKIRAVSAAGEPIPLDDIDGEQVVTDNWLRQTFPPPGRPVAPAVPETAHERYLDAMAKVGKVMDAVDHAVRRLLAVEGVDGLPIQTEGVDPADADAWLEDVMQLMQLIPVWRNTHASRYGASSWPATWDGPADDGADLDEDADYEAGGWDDEEETQ